MNIFKSYFESKGKTDNLFQKLTVRFNALTMGPQTEDTVYFSKTIHGASSQQNLSSITKEEAVEIIKFLQMFLED